MNMKEASEHPERLAKMAADESWAAMLHVAEVVRRSGGGLDDDQKLHAASAIEQSAKAYMDAVACEKHTWYAVNNREEQLLSANGCVADDIVGEVRRKENKVADELNQAMGGGKRYCGDAMLADDIARHSIYDLHGLDLRIQDIRHLFAEQDPDTGDIVDVWQYDVIVPYNGMKHFFTASFREDDHAISNSAAAFDSALDNELTLVRDPLVRHLELKSLPEAQAKEDEEEKMFMADDNNQ